MFAEELVQPRVMAQQTAPTVSVQKVIIIPPRGQASKVSDVLDAHAVPIKTWSVIKKHAIPAVQGHIHGIGLRHVLPVVQGNIQGIELHYVIPAVQGPNQGVKLHHVMTVMKVHIQGRELPHVLPAI